MDTLKHTVRRVVAEYAGKMLNGYGYLTSSDDSLLFMVIDIAKYLGKHTMSVNLIVRIVGDQVVIEIDYNDKLVVDALMQAGVPRSQIVLAYAGEPVPEGAMEKPAIN